MPQTPHSERHCTGSAIMRDIVIGMADGRPVAFTLATGLAGARDSTALIVTTGLTEVAAGSIAMDLGGHLAARSDGAHDASERIGEQHEIDMAADLTTQEVATILAAYGVEPAQSTPIKPT